MEEKTKNQKQEKDDCPLCSVSDETMKRLEEKGQTPKTAKAAKNRQSSRRARAGILIFVLALGAFVVYVFSQERQIHSQEPQAAELQEVERQGAEPEPQQIDFASDFTSQDAFGNLVSLSDFRNQKPVLLVFWATWCGFCAKEMPDLKNFTAKHRDEVQVLAIPSGESREALLDYIEKEDINFSMLLDENREIWNAYLVRGTPSHFLVDKKGEIITVFPGLATADNLETMFSMVAE